MKAIHWLISLSAIGCVAILCMLYLDGQRHREKLRADRYHARYLAEKIAHGGYERLDQAVREIHNCPHLEPDTLEEIEYIYRPVYEDKEKGGWRLNQLTLMHRTTLRDYYSSKWRQGLASPSDPSPKQFDDVNR